MIHRILLSVIVVAVIAFMLMLASPMNMDAGGYRRTMTPIVITIVPGPTTTLWTRTPTARWTPVVWTIVPGPTVTLPTKTPIAICSRSFCR